MADDQGLDLENLDAPTETSLRRAHVVDLYRRGLTFAEIGAQLGVTKQRAHQIYWEAMDAVLDKAVSARRAAMAEQLDEVVRVASAVMARDHIAHSNGRVVTMTDEAGVDQPILDDGPKLDAGRTIIAAVARLAKMIGADAVEKVEQDTTLRYEIVGVEPGDVA